MLGYHHGHDLHYDAHGTGPHHGGTDTCNSDQLMYLDRNFSPNASVVASTSALTSAEHASSGLDKIGAIAQKLLAKTNDLSRSLDGHLSHQCSAISPLVATYRHFLKEYHSLAKGIQEQYANGFIGGMARDSDSMASQLKALESDAAARTSGIVQHSKLAGNLAHEASRLALQLKTHAASARNVCSGSEDIVAAGKAHGNDAQVMKDLSVPGAQLPGILSIERVGLLSAAKDSAKLHRLADEIGKLSSKVESLASHTGNVVAATPGLSKPYPSIARAVSVIASAKPQLVVGMHKLGTDAKIPDVELAEKRVSEAMNSVMNDARQDSRLHVTNKSLLAVRSDLAAITRSVKEMLKDVFAAKGVTRSVIDDLDWSGVHRTSKSIQDMVNAKIKGSCMNDNVVIAGTRLPTRSGEGSIYNFL